MPSATRVLAFLLVFTALFLFALMLAVAIEFSDEPVPENACFDRKEW